MQITFGRILSLLIAIGSVVAVMVASGEVVASLFLFFFLCIPLALIWFADEIGAIKDCREGNMYIDQETPGIIIAFFGWLILLGVPAWLLYCIVRGRG